MINGALLVEAFRIEVGKDKRDMLERQRPSRKVPQQSSSGCSNDEFAGIKDITKLNAAGKDDVPFHHFSQVQANILQRMNSW